MEGNAEKTIYTVIYSLRICFLPHKTIQVFISAVVHPVVVDRKKKEQKEKVGEKRKPFKVLIHVFHLLFLCKSNSCATFFLYYALFRRIILLRESRDFSLYIGLLRSLSGISIFLIFVFINVTTMG